MLVFVRDVVVFLLLLGVLIGVHEYGHFWVARRCGVKVLRFSIGFGKVLYRRYDKYGTEFVLSMIPLGGYVKMLDERIEPVAPQEQSYAFNRKTIGQRAAIISAGPIANFLLAFLACWVVFIIGVPGVKPIVGQVSPNSIAAEANISPGMELKSVDGIETPDWETARLALVNYIGNEEVEIGIANLGSDNVMIRKLNLRQWQFDTNKVDIISSLGITPRGNEIEPILSEVMKESAAAKAGLREGDRILRINGLSVDRWDVFVQQVRNHPDEAIALDIERDGEKIPLTIVPGVKTLKDGTRIGLAGVFPTVMPLPDEYRVVRQYGPFAALYEAGGKTKQLIVTTANMLGKLITGDVKLDSLGGPISLAKGAGGAAGYGLVAFLIFLAFISINLGIINLLPLPILDGGHLLFLLVEKIKGAPVSEQVLEFCYRIGAVVLVMIMGLALFNDFSRI